jgi:hypothetical protein
MRFQSTEFAYVCPRCGEEFERSSAWQMSLLEGHDDLHTQLEKEGK